MAIEKMVAIGKKSLLRMAEEEVNSKGRE